MNNREFYRAQFRSVMIVIRHIADESDAEMAQFLHRELKRELPELEKKFRLENSVVVESSSIVAPSSAEN